MKAQWVDSAALTSRSLRASDYVVEDSDIRALMHEAGVHGDHEQVDLCLLALNGDPEALEQCCDVIRNNRMEN